MNAPAAPQGLDFAAIGVGVAVGIGGSIALSLLWTLLPVEAVASRIWIVVTIGHLFGAIVDIASGATAGWLARQRGSLHGLFAGLIANIASLAVGYTLTVLRTDFGDSVEEVIAYLVAVVPWQVIGVALASLAGAIAVRFANRAHAGGA